MNYSKEDIEDKIESAVSLLVARDPELLDIDAHERSISHKLAIYLERYFENWDIDCEYNRLEKEVKRVDSPSQLREIFGEVEEKIEEIKASDDEAKTVYPDIIVHQRLEQENLLVIEIKKTTSDEDKDNVDKAKLAKFRNQLEYENTAFLKIKTKTNFMDSPACNREKTKEAIEELKINENWIELIE